MFNKSIGKAGLNFGTICETGAQSTRRAQFLLSKDQGWTEAAGKFPGILEKPTKIRLAVFSCSGSDEYSNLPESSG